MSNINSVRAILDGLEQAVDFEFDYDLSGMEVTSITATTYGIEEISFSDARADMPRIERTEEQEQMWVARKEELERIYTLLDDMEAQLLDRQRGLRKETLQETVKQAVSTVLRGSLVLRTAHGAIFPADTAHIAVEVSQKTAQMLEMAGFLSED